MIDTLTLTQALLALATLTAASPVPVQRASFLRKAVVSYPTGASTGNSSGISWGPCPDSFPSNVTCGTYTVPLDWEHPRSNETIELGIVRLEAKDRANRIGNLFINPGGPGGAASSLVVGLAGSPERVDPRILERFDIIGLDPRGVGLSTPVQCDPNAWNKRVSFFPKTQKEFEALVAYNRAVAKSCRAKTGRLIDFVDTISAVRDHEAVRKALGGEKANFLGLSYGTQLFSQYAELYPNNFRALVLDGNLQHSQSESSNLLIESTTYEATLKQFFTWCAGTEECPLHGQDVQAKYTSVLAKATTSPIPAPGCDDKTCRSELSEEDLRFTLQGFLIAPAAWPGLAQALLDADNGNATLISQQQPLAVGDAYTDSSLYAGTAIACQDWTHASSSLADIQGKATLGAAYSPLTRGACQSYKIQTSCIGWPAPLTNPPRPVKYKGSTPILMVHSTYDPSTAYTWGLGLHAELGNKSVLLTRNGTGHTSYLGGPGETVSAANEYLLELTLPQPGTILQT
ncbi:hypothetical protein AAE478_003855 [Parahypoxylon ruwenzoriense]